MIDLVLEKAEEVIIMQRKEFCRSLGSTTATTLRLAEPYWDTRRTAVANSLFASVKTCTELLDRGLYTV